MLSAATTILDTPAGWLGATILGIWVVMVLITLHQHRKHAGQTNLKTCPGCSTPNPSHAKFCRKCGKKLE